MANVTAPRSLPCTCRGASLARRIPARQPARRPRGAYTLLELLAVVIVLGLIAAAAVGSFRPETFGDLGAHTDARRLALDVIQTRRRAIATGENHLLALQFSGPDVVGYTVERRLGGGGTEAVDSFRRFSDRVTVGISPVAGPEFDFEGAALASSTITITGPHRTWQVTITQATGAVAVVEL